MIFITPHLDQTEVYSICRCHGRAIVGYMPRRDVRADILVGRRYFVHSHPNEYLRVVLTRHLGSSVVATAAAYSWLASWSPEVGGKSLPVVAVLRRLCA